MLMFIPVALAAALSALRDADARVAAVAWRLQTSNASACLDTVALPGFTVETLDQYTRAERNEATAEFGLKELPQISAVVPGSSAEKAGLRKGDVLLAIDGAQTSHAIAEKPSYARTALVEKALTSALARPPVTLMLATRTVIFSGDPGCPSNVQLVPGGMLDATADGRYVQITGTMYNFIADDNELAFIIAHELAHNIVAEARRAGASSEQRKAELAADRAAIRMMAKAGYDVGAVVPLMERLRSKNHLWWLDGSHPGWPVRLKAARAAIVEQISIQRASDQAR